jgi:hypothetical protein
VCLVWHKSATKHQYTKENVSQLLEEIKLHHQAMDAGHPLEKPPCPRWTKKQDCRGRVIWRGQVTRTGLKVGTEDPMPEVILWQCECHLHGWFRVYTPFILPYKHYAPLRVDAALEGAADGGDISELCSAVGIHDPCTPRRWIAQWATRLPAMGKIVRRRVCLLVHHRPGVVVKRVRCPSDWTFRSAWDFLAEVQAGWPRVTQVPPLSYFALKA